MTKHYSNGEITVTWRPDLCQHSGICAGGLPAVFNPRRRPWIDLEAADSATIKAQVDRCPSGALTWTRAANGPADEDGTMAPDESGTGGRQTPGR